MSTQLITRRSFAVGLSMVAGSGSLAVVAIARPLRTEVEVAVENCRDARRARDAALDTYERALPPPHPSLDMTNYRPRPFIATVERRLFDGAVPKRGIDFLGNPGERYVATVETIEQDLRRCPPENRGRRRLLYRMRRRAAARAAQVEKLEASFQLEELQGKVDAAERELEELAQELFKVPATSMAAVLVQAKALSTYAETIEAGHAQHQAGRFGKVLADGLQHVARAT